MFGFRRSCSRETRLIVRFVVLLDRIDYGEYLKFYKFASRDECFYQSDVCFSLVLLLDAKGRPPFLTFGSSSAEMDAASRCCRLLLLYR